MRTEFDGEYRVEKFVGEKDVTPFGSFPEGTSVIFRITVPRRYAALSAELVLFSDKGGEGNFPLAWKCSEAAFDVYEGEVSGVSKGLYFYRIVFKIKWGERSVPNFRDCGDIFQLSFYDREFKSPEWQKGGIMYQIFPDRFNRSGMVFEKEGSVSEPDWYNGIPQYAEKRGDPVPNNVFFGGDLYGIAEKLEYIASLGVTILYLNPIFEASSNHRYDVGDYMKIDPLLGGEDGFKTLLSAADKYGIRVILDGVFNHTGDDSLYFNRYGHYGSSGAYQSEKSVYLNWYKFRKYPDDYECWWGVKIMPATDKDNPEFRKFINGENGVVRHYLSEGISGWRLDVADELNDEFLKELRTSALREKNDTFVIGEVWEDASNKISYDRRRKYFTDGELDSVMNYPVRSAIISYMLHGDSENIASVTARLYEHYPKHVSDSLMNIIGTHDTERILTVLGGQPAGNRTNRELATAVMNETERTRGKKLLKLAYLLSATLPGIPCIYYGDEIGMEGYGDPFNRRPYPWGREDTELLDFYIGIGKLRRSRREFSDGIYHVIYARKGIFAFGRDSLVVIMNRSGKDFVYEPKALFENIENTATRRAKDLLSGKKLSGREILAEDSAAVIVFE